mmetsp:Transcript_56747/g.68277  ORF Transcript_56747/g.68277 Transcript_56747/m.68277 type:complete len:220 (-) Transcript_56747:1051-1710(-)
MHPSHLKARRKFAFGCGPSQIKKVTWVVQKEVPLSATWRKIMSVHFQRRNVKGYRHLIQIPASQYDIFRKKVEWHIALQWMVANRGNQCSKSLQVLPLFSSYSFARGIYPCVVDTRRPSQNNIDGRMLHHEGVEVFFNTFKGRIVRNVLNPIVFQVRIVGRIVVVMMDMVCHLVMFDMNHLVHGHPQPLEGDNATPNATKQIQYSSGPATVLDLPHLGR